MADLMKKKHQLRLIELEESVLVAQVVAILCAALARNTNDYFLLNEWNRA